MGKQRATIRLDGVSRWLLVLLVVLIAGMWLFPRPLEAKGQDNAELERQVLRRILGLLDEAETELVDATCCDPDAVIAQADLQTLRTQVQLFKVEMGRFPGVDVEGRFDPDRFIRELTSRLENDGMPKGPWLSEMPRNAATESKAVKQAADVENLVSDPSAGWIFDPATGGVWAAHDVSL